MSSSNPIALPSREQLAVLSAYQSPDDRQAAWQVGSTFGLYFLLLVATYASAHFSALLTLALSLSAAGLIVRIFMLQHDCGHNSLFHSVRINRIVGVMCSVATLTPFAYWRRLHARHHSSWNNLDRRGVPADFYSDCLTLEEYRLLSRRQQWLYRVSHHAALIHVLLPPIIFTVLYRLPFDTPASCKTERHSVYLLNFTLIALYGALIAIFGLRMVLLVHVPAITLSAIIGIWLFSVQHRFEEAQWSHEENWTATQSALQGASYLKLPAILCWLSANVGVHHIHHLRPGIPNYRLQACHSASSALTGAVTTLSLATALKAPSYMLWDEASGRMVPFPETRSA
ncbi:MAG: fatty acid desaturase family protein [Janthinobacterium lividum]